MELSTGQRAVWETLPSASVFNQLEDIDEPLPGTTDWVLSQDWFRTWLRSKDQHVLRIVGKRGSGKSVLAAYLFRTGIGQISRRTLFYHSFTLHQDMESASSAWSALMRQMLVTEPALFPFLRSEEQILRGVGSQTWTAARLKHAFVRLAREYRRPSVIIVDGLDQCDETLEKFVQSLSDILSGGAGPGIKLLLLGRYDSHTADLSERFENSFYVDLDDELEHERAVQRFVQHNVADLCRRRSCAQMSDMISTRLLKAAQGMYLLPMMAVTSLTKIHATPANILLELDRLPDSLLAAYRQALNSVPVKSRPIVGSVLLWVVFGLRPLTLGELSSLVALESHIATPQDLRMNTTVDLLGEAGVSMLLGPLLKVAKKGDEAFLILMHNSAREFLRRTDQTKKDDNNLSPPYWLLKVFYGKAAFRRSKEGQDALAGRVLTDLCVRYFSAAVNLSSDPPRKPRDVYEAGFDAQERLAMKGPIFTDLPGLRYVIEHLPEHVRPLPDGYSFARLLERFSGQKFIATFWSLKDPGEVYGDQPPLHFACALGLPNLVADLLRLGHRPMDFDDLDNTALDVAVAAGVVDTLRMLCSVGGIDARSTLQWRAPRSGRFKYYNLLHVAAWYGYRDMVNYLLGLGLSTTYRDDLKRTPIDIAISAGYKEVAGLMMSRNHVPHEVASAAVTYDHVDTLKWLVEDYGVNFLSPNHGKSLIQEAADRSASDCLAYFASKMTDQEICSPQGRDIFFYAAAHGHVPLLKAIMAHDGFDINARNQKERTALHEACGECEPDAIWELILAGIDATVVDAEGNTPLDCLFRYSFRPSSASKKALDAFENPRHRIQLPARGGSLLHDFLRARQSATAEIHNFEMVLRTVKSWDNGLVAAGVDRDGNTVHHLAAAASDNVYREVARVLEPTDQQNNLGQTVLHAFLLRNGRPSPLDTGYWRSWSAPAPDKQVFSELLTKFESWTEVKDQWGCIPLHLAATLNKEAFLTILTATESVNSQDDNGRTPLMMRISATDQIERPVLDGFLAKGYNMDLVDAAGRPALWYALNLDDSIFDRMALAAKDIGKSLDRGGRNILHEYLNPTLKKRQYPPTLPRLQKLLGYNVDVLHRNTEGKRPLDDLIERLSARCAPAFDNVISSILAHGETLGRFSNELKCRLLAEMALRNHSGDADALLDSLGGLAGFQPDTALQDWTGRKAQPVLVYLASKRQTPSDYAHIPFQIAWDLELVDAAAAGKLARAQALVAEQGASVDACDPWRRTALTLAAERGHSDVVLFLLDRGAATDTEDNFGRTALYWAARGDQPDIAKLLISRGATVTRYAAALLDLAHPEKEAVDVRGAGGRSQWSAPPWISEWKVIFVAVFVTGILIATMPSFRFASLQRRQG